MSETDQMRENNRFIDSFENMSEAAHAQSRKSGFWDSRDQLQRMARSFSDELERVAIKAIDSQLRELIISELGEACEGDRKNLMDDKIPGFTAVEAELADVIIRIGDYCAARKLRVAEAVIAKMRMNATREPMHGGKSF